MGKYRLVKQSEFRLNSGEHDTWYALEIWHKNWRGKYSWRSVKRDAYEGMNVHYESEPATGDLAWAKRVAEEYNITVPTEGGIDK